MTNVVPKTWICVCGKEHQVAAHIRQRWTEDHTLVCPDCQRRYNYLCGKATLTFTPQKTVDPSP